MTIKTNVDAKPTLQLPPKNFLTVQESCSHLSVSVAHFYKRIAPAIKVTRSGRKVLVPIAELDRYVAENTRKGSLPYAPQPKAPRQPYF